MSCRKAQRIRIATRASSLALWQASHVATALTTTPIAAVPTDVAPTTTPTTVVPADSTTAAVPTTELVHITTEGDKNPNRPIEQIAGRGVFVAAVQAAVLDGLAEVAVHSAKDMRSQPTPGLTLVGCMRRSDVRDALVGSALADLPTGAVVATGSPRRKCQLAHLRPDLTFVGLRGNIETRLAAANRADVAAVVVALAALERLELTYLATEILSPEDVLPQAGQGAIAVECRSDDDATRAALAKIIDPATSLCVTAERAVLAGFGGGCDLPVGALATLTNDPISGALMPGASIPDAPHLSTTAPFRLELTALLSDIEGRQLLRSTSTADEVDSNVAAVDLGTELARHLLEDLGGAELLAQVPNC